MTSAIDDYRDAKKELDEAKKKLDATQNSMNPPIGTGFTSPSGPIKEAPQAPVAELEQHHHAREKAQRAWDALSDTDKASVGLRP